MYGEPVRRRDVAVMDGDGQQSKHYHLALLEKVGDGRILWQESNLLYAGIKGKEELVASLDFVESILRRGPQASGRRKSIWRRSWMESDAQKKGLTESNVQMMFAEQATMDQGGGASICHSAILECGYGSQDYVLNLNNSHGKYAGLSAQIDVKDGKSDNKISFGYCKKLKSQCVPVPSDWYNGNEDDLMFDEETLDMEASVQIGVAFMVCTAKKGDDIAFGMITAKTDGQSLEGVKKKTLRMILNEYYEDDIGHKWRRVYSSDEALDIVMENSNIIEESSKKYGVIKSYIQSILYREIYCIGYEDIPVDVVVMFTLEYEMSVKAYQEAPWWQQLIMGTPHNDLLLYRKDSSTGYGQTFASTAIGANNWAVSKGIIEGKIYDRENFEDLAEVWNKLKSDNKYSIDMVGMVLGCESERLGINGKTSLSREEGVTLLARYNGPNARAYGELLYDHYVSAFEQYNNGLIEEGCKKLNYRINEE